MLEMTGQSKGHDDDIYHFATLENKLNEVGITLSVGFAEISLQLFMTVPQNPLRTYQSFAPITTCRQCGGISRDLTCLEVNFLYCGAIFSLLTSFPPPINVELEVVNNINVRTHEVKQIR